MTTVAKVVETKKIYTYIFKTLQAPLEASKSIKAKEGACVSFKTDLMVKAAKRKANHVLGLPIIVFSQRVESITYKATISNEFPVQAKSRSEDGSRKQENLTFKSHLE